MTRDEAKRELIKDIQEAERLILDGVISEERHRSNLTAMRLALSDMETIEMLRRVISRRNVPMVLGDSCYRGGKSHAFWEVLEYLNNPDTLKAEIEMMGIEEVEP